ncbi:MAG: hypothetical protein IPK13_21575 [Deltaproteobacteria bacterium]|nr:hypothetical protein [Deltaproteobacteria bacterium]
MLTLASVAEEKDETAFQDPAVEEFFKFFTDKCRQPGLTGIGVLKTFDKLVKVGRDEPMQDSRLRFSWFVFRNRLRAHNAP